MGGGGEGVLVACLGDVLLDVIVETSGALVTDDDTPARITFAAGGQAANVATWVAALGGRARVFGPRSGSGPGHLVEEALTARGVEVWGSAAKSSSIREIRPRHSASSSVSITPTDRTASTSPLARASRP